MKLEELEGGKDLLESITSLKKQIEGAETLLQTHKNEAGEVRNMAKEIKEIIGDKENFKKTLDSIKSKLDNVGVVKDKVPSAVGNDAAGNGNEGEQVTEIKKKMTEVQRVKADSVFKKLKPEERAAIKSDPKKQADFLKAAIEAEPHVPESLFDDESAGSEDGHNGYRAMFGLVDKEKNFVPGGRNVGASGFSGSENQPESISKRLIGGKIPRPQAGTKREE